jgi:hypothetical protein
VRLDYSVLLLFYASAIALLSTGAMPEQSPYRRVYPPDPLPFQVDQWDDRGNLTKCIGRAEDMEMGRALFWCAVAKNRGKDRITLRWKAQILEKSPNDF